MSDGIPCPKCGRVHGQCLGHGKSGLPCRRPPKAGGVCHLHGGSAPQTMAKEAERNMMRRIAAELTSWGMPLVEEHPIEGLLKRVWESARAVVFYGMLVSELDIPEPHPSPLSDVVGVDEDGDPIMAQSMSTLYGRSHTGDLAPHILVTLWDRERERHAKLCKLALDAGVAERMIQLAESQAEQIVRVLTAVFEDPELALTAEQRSSVRTVAARHLRAVPMIPRATA